MAENKGKGEQSLNTGASALTQSGPARFEQVHAKGDTEWRELGTCCNSRLTRSQGGPCMYQYLEKYLKSKHHTGPLLVRDS
jgi:hypothetical protein